MNEILVSAIITTHNRSALLERAIKSVQIQSYENIELIVIDDASDHIHRKKNEELAKNVVYHYISKEESQGGNYARNVGIEMSSGALLAFLDDDDVWDPAKIEKQVARYQATHFEVIGCGQNRITVKNGIILYRSSIVKEGEGGKDFSEVIFRGPPFVTSELMITRDALISVGEFDVTLKAWQEYDLLIRLSDQYVFGCVEETLVDYYEDLSSTNRLSNKLDVFLYSFPIIEEKYRERISSLPLQLRIGWRKLFLRECLHRSTNKSERKGYRKQLFFLEKSFKNLAFYILNPDPKNEYVEYARRLRNMIIDK